MKNTLLSKLFLIIILFFIPMVSVYAYDYTITSMTLQDSAGNNLQQVPSEESFYVEVTATKNTDTSTKDILIIAMYDKDGAVIDMSYMKGQFKQNQEIVFGTLFQPNGMVIKTIKAFVWDSLTGMKPLGTSFTMEIPDNSVTPEPDIPDESIPGMVILENALIESATTAKITYCESANATSLTRYVLAHDAEFYVNDVSLGSVTTALIDQYLLSQYSGTIKLVDDEMTEGTYDKVYVDCYATAKVSAVSGTNITISGTHNFNESVSVIDLNTTANTDLSYKIHHNGEQITISDLQKDDIISIKYDVTVPFADSSFYDIYISRENVSGMISAKNANDKCITIGTQQYTLLDWSLSNNILVGNEYGLLLDFLGRIYDVEQLATPQNYAMLLATVSDVSGNQVKLLLSDGATVIYPMATFYKITDERLGGTDNVTFTDIRTNYLTAPIDYSKLVVTYTLKNNSVTNLTFLNVNNTPTMTAFNSKTGSVSDMYISPSTVVFDATKQIENNNSFANLLETSSYDSFIDGQEYTVYGYVKEGSNYAVALILDTNLSYNEAPSLSVVPGSGSMSGDEDNEGYDVNVNVGTGENNDLFIDKGDTTITDITTGDAIIIN